MFFGVWAYTFSKFLVRNFLNSVVYNGRRSLVQKPPQNANIFEGGRCVASCFLNNRKFCCAENSSNDNNDGKMQSNSEIDGVLFHVFQN